MVQLARTTAELVLRSAEGVHLLGPDASTSRIATFSGGPDDRARSALALAEELGLVTQGAAPDHWNATDLARICCHSNPSLKQLIVRYQLESYDPYVTFRDRILAGELPRDAAMQSCLTHALSIDPHDAEETLKDFGLYGGAMAYGQGHELLVEVDSDLQAQLLVARAAFLGERDTIRAHIVDQLGVDAVGFATGEPIDFLIDAYMEYQGGQSKSAMTLLGKGLEAFLKKLLAETPPVPLPGGPITMGKAAKLLKDNSRLTSKHYAMCMAIVEIRNAAEHPLDTEINATWDISQETALLASRMTWRLMNSIFDGKNGVHRL